MRIIKSIGLIIVFGLLLSSINAQEPPELFLQTGQQGDVTVEYSPNGRFFVSQGRSEIKIHDAATGLELRSFVQDARCVGGFAISPDSQILASCGKDGKTFLWKIQTGEAVASFDDGRNLIFGANGETVSIFGGRDLRNFNISAKTLTEDNSFDFDSMPYTDLSALSPNGKFFAGASTSDDKNKLIYLAASNTRTKPLILQGHSATIENLLFSPDSRFLASEDEQGTVKLWEAETGKLLFDFNCNSKTDFLLGIPIGFSFDSKMLLTTCEVASATDTTKNVAVWDTATGAKTKTFLIHSENDFKFFDRHLPVSLALSPNSQTLLIGRNGGEIKMYEFPNGKAIRLLNGRILRSADSLGEIGRSGTPLAISPDGKTLANGGGDFGIRFWDLAESGGFKSSRLFYDLSGKNPLDYYQDAPFAFNPNGKDFLCQTVGDVVSVDLVSRKSRLFFTDPRRTVKTKRTAKDDKLSFQINALTYSPNGTKVAVKASLALVDLEKSESSPSKEYVYLLDAKTGRIIYQSTRKGYSDSAALAFSPDSKLLAVSDAREGVVLWNMRTGKIEKTLKKNETESTDETNEEPAAEEDAQPVYDDVNSLTFSPDGKLLAVGTNNSLQLWSVMSGDLLKDTAEDSDGVENVSSSSDYQTVIESVAFSPNGQFIASGKGDGSIQLIAFSYSEDEGIVFSKTVEMKGHTDSIVTAAFSSDGKKIFSSSDDTTIKIWNSRDGKLLATLIATSPKNWLVATPEGVFDGTAYSWKKVSWRFDNNTFDYAPAESFFKECYYPGLLGEIMHGKTPRPPAKELSRIDIRQPKVKIASLNNQTAIWQNSGSVENKVVPIEIEVVDNTDTGRRNDFPTSSGARDLRLFRNGSLVRVWRGDVFELGEKDDCTQIIAQKGQRKAICQAQVSITADENTFYAYAFNHDDVKSADATAYLLGAKSLKKDATIYVLAVGVNEYQNPKFNLNFAVADVDKIAAEIAANQTKLAPKQFAKTEIIKLINADATKPKILDALSTLAKQIQPEDALVIYFSGHGKARCTKDVKMGATNCDRFYLIPNDGTPTFAIKPNPALWMETAYKQSISDEELEAALEKIDAGKMLMVIDACNSGQALEAEEKRRAPMNSRGLAQLAYEKGMYILTASQSQQAALETSKLGHGFLTFALLEGFTKADEDKNKSIIEREWLDFAVQAVPQLQLEAMTAREAEVRKTPNKKQLLLVEDEAESLLPADKRQLQTPRIFYRRESEMRPLVVAKP
jgi:WD40 repeat protein/uncharacterized caspase-like protein